MPPFNPHPVLAAVLVALAVWHVRSVAGESRRRALLAWIVLALVTLWPIGDLASSVSLSIATAQRLVQRAHVLQKQTPRYQQDVLILGPAKAPLFKLRNKFRFQVIVKCAQPQSLNQFCRQIIANDKWIEAGTKVQVDIDPFQML